MSELVPDQHEPTLRETGDVLLDLHASIAEMVFVLGEIAAEAKPGASRIEDVDLVAAGNPAAAQVTARAAYDAALQIDNPYAVTLEARASWDGGGQVIMRVPPHSSRVLTVLVRELSLRALGAPAGAIPATVVRFDRPQPAGLYPYAP